MTERKVTRRDNGGPRLDISLLEMARLVGSKQPMRLPDTTDAGAPWTTYADKDDLEDLAILDLRIFRMMGRLARYRKQRRTIMQRCIKRMQRDKG